MRKLLLDFCYLLFFFHLALCGSSILFAQESHQDSIKSDSTRLAQKATYPQSLTSSGNLIVLEYVKDRIEQSSDSALFNILKVTNIGSSVINGTVTLSTPSGWQIFSQNRINLTVAPGSTEFIPIRVTMARTVLGGVSYLIGVTFTSTQSIFKGRNQTSVSKSCYITIPKVRNWNVMSVARTVYFDRYVEYAPLKLKLSNFGNGYEMVKLDFNIGSSLEMFGLAGKTYFMSIEVPPHKDTILSFPVKYHPSDESDLWNRDFNKLTISVKARVDTVVKTTFFNFKYLESNYNNTLFGKVTPLTVDIMLNNLLSESSPTLYTSAYGAVLLKNEARVDYNVQLMNVPFTWNKPLIDLSDYIWKNSRMWGAYTTDKWEVKAGDIYSYSTSLLSSVGRGIGGRYKFNDNTSVGGLFTKSIVSPIYGANLFGSNLIKGTVPLLSNISAIIDNYNRLNAFSASLQANYLIFPGHTVSLLVSPSLTQHKYSNQTFTDAQGDFIKTNDPGISRIGFASILTYQLSLKKTSGSLSLLYASKDFYQYYSGKVNISANVTHSLNKKFYLLGTSGLMIQDPKIYSRGMLYPENYYLTGIHKIEVAGRLTNKLTAFAGPMLEHLSFRALKISRMGDSTTAYFQSISPKLSVRCSYRNNLSGFITPYLMVGYTYITRAEDPTITPSLFHTPQSTFFNSRMGINVIQHNWGVNVFYYLGPRDYVTQMDYYYFGRYSKSIRIMPFFQKYYFNKQMLFSSYSSYYYEVASNSERVNLSGRLEFFLGRDWTLLLNNNLFFMSSINTEGQKSYARSYFLSLGVKKSFDIPQPRLKYYNLRVVCFKDYNGNKKQDDNEQGISDVVITVDRRSIADSIYLKTRKEQGQFSPAELLTDNFGQVSYNRIPGGEFSLRIIPMQNLVDFYNQDGQSQKFFISRDTTIYIPFVQSYRITGKVILNRDEYSSLGNITISNVRVIATDSLGNSYPALTSPDGSYVLYVPQDGTYSVNVNNVFGDNFSLQESNYAVSFSGEKNFSLDFVFNEKKRQINLNGVSTSLDAILGKHTSIVYAGKDTLRNVSMVQDTKLSSSSPNEKAKQSSYLVPVGDKISYKVQITTSTKRIPQSQYATRFKGVTNVFEYSENGIYKYTVGNESNVDAARKIKDQMRGIGYDDAFIVPFHKGVRVSYK